MNDVSNRIRDIEYYEKLEKKVRELNRDKQMFSHEISNLQSNLKSTNETMQRMEKMVNS
jgi:prefoldin subunit 5